MLGSSDSVVCRDIYFHLHTLREWERGMVRGRVGWRHHSPFG